jgi:predicted nucleic acid-binding protein
MRVLLDTNVIIHRETATPVNNSIGELFKWLDNLHHSKCIHQITVAEIEKYADKLVVDSFKIKLQSYNLITTQAPVTESISKIIAQDRDENGKNDSLLLNELLNNRVDCMISEDRGIRHKAGILGISDKVFTIDSFLERVNAENPELLDYKVLSIKKEKFGEVNLSDAFFDSFREDYKEFDKWFNKKSEEVSYTCKKDGKLIAFLYLKREDENESYADVSPIFERNKKLKIGTFKVEYNGFKLGERFIKIIFDNALKMKVNEIYVTIFKKSPEQERLIELLNEFGFEYWGIKTTQNGEEQVYVRKFEPRINSSRPKTTYPYINGKGNKYLVAIYPEYHTNLLPDSILSTESAKDFEELQPYRNAIGKVFISRSFEKSVQGGYYKSVITTIGVVEKIVDSIEDVDSFIGICGKRSVFSKDDLIAQWNYKENNRPFVIFFLYTYSFPHRLNMKELIDLKVIKDFESAPRGLLKITNEQFKIILKETKTDESIVVY